jgi:hypothetical protein
MSEYENYGCSMKIRNRFSVFKKRFETGFLFSSKYWLTLSFVKVTVKVTVIVTGMVTLMMMVTETEVNGG